MAIILVGNYAKRLGLPGFSSHQFSVSIETELTDTGDIQGEAARIYELLQDAVDREIQETGFVPSDDYGQNNAGNRIGSNGISHPYDKSNGNGRSGRYIDGNTGSNGHSNRWACSHKQKSFIERLIHENNLDRGTIEQTAKEKFGTGLQQLNKLQASGLIGELLETCGMNGNGGRR